MFDDDLEQLEAGMTLYDAFYRWCRDASGETHNWPATRRNRNGCHDGQDDRGRRSRDLGHGISFGEAFRVWLRVALLSFGGPAGQIAVMHRILVEEKRWISESRFLHALNYCMLLPGPEAQQLATYIGWLMHRTAGGIMAGGLFILPGIIAIMALSYVYAAYGNVGFVAALFFGLKAAVLAIVVQAVVRIGKRALSNRVMIALAAIGLHGDLLLQRPVPGHHPRRRRDRLFRRPRHRLAQFAAVGHGGGKDAGAVDSLLGEELPDHARPSSAARCASSVWLALWLVPVGAVLLLGSGRPTCSARSRCSSPRWRW